MKVRAIKLRDVDFGTEWRDVVDNRWVYDDFKRNEKWRTGWISFDCAFYRPQDDLVYCGITSFDSEFFVAYDRKADSFVKLGVDRVSNEFDAKFHRALLQGKDGCLYGAIALLHCIDKYEEAPGGAVVRYDPENDIIEKLGIPVPHVYIQSLVLDEEHGMAYGLGFHPQCLLAFDLKKKEGRMLGYITSGYGGGVMSENIVLDDDGCVWSNWGLTRAWAYDPGPEAIRLCKYDPAADKIIFSQKGLPRADGSYGTAPVESFHNFGDGSLYAGADNGSLYRINPDTFEGECLCVPIQGRRSRLASLVHAGNGIAYGVVGRDGKCELARFHYTEGRCELLGQVKDGDTGAEMWQCHDIVMSEDGMLYACENDNVHRSGYLWEIVL